MNAIPVEVSRVESPVKEAPSLEELHADMQRARFLANLLDAQFSFAGIRFGLDALVGLIPVVGDTITSIAGLYPIWIAQRHGLGMPLRLRMAMNVAIDWGVGLVPLVGDMLDVAYKANLKNLALLEKAVEAKLRRR